MKLFLKTFLSTLMLSVALFAQEDKDFPAIGIADIPGGTITRTNYFDGNALWGHIDGGADLYLEYGFDKLLFQEIAVNGIVYRVEYYKMKDAEAAFGIYSVSHFKCGKQDTLTRYICINPFQIQSALGRFYISISNDKGSKDAGKIALMFFEKILAGSREKVLELPDLFAKKEFTRYNAAIKLIKGKLGFQNGFPNWEEMFNDFSGYTLFLLPVEREKSFVNIAQVSFASENDLKSFLGKNKMMFEDDKMDYLVTENSIAKKIHLIDAQQLMFYETNNERLLAELSD